MNQSTPEHSGDRGSSKKPTVGEKLTTTEVRPTRAPVTKPKADHAPPAIDRIEVPKIETKRILVPIIGTAPLLQCKFPEKAKRQMLDKMQGRATPKTKRDPDADFHAAMWKIKDPTGYGFPSVAFKSATIGAARYYGKAISMTELRQLIFFAGELSDDPAPVSLTRLDCDEPSMREDYVRISAGGTDLRYRPMFLNWRALLDVTFVASCLAQESLLSLIGAGGLGGVGEWRPAGKKSTGDFGTFEIDTDREITVIG